MVGTIIEASRRARDLTAKLLAFSRKGGGESVPVDMIQTIRDTLELLERTVDKRIEISHHVPEKQIYVQGDSSQLQSGLLNIMLNARDAITPPGRIEIAAAEVDITNDDRYRGGVCDSR